jgi:cold shock CspA family protein
MSDRIVGTIVAANPKGFYWIKRDDGQSDVYLADKQLQIDKLMPLAVGTRLEFDTWTHNRGQRAFNVTVL